MNKREKNNLILIGFMASSKTTLSKKLEDTNGYIRISTDDMIVEKMQMSISEIFEKYGEAFFREQENEILGTIIDMLKNSNEKYVVDCGGGVVSAHNFQELKTLGEVCYLNVPYEKIFKRLENDTTRPLAVDFQNLRTLYRLRLKEYKKFADFEYFGNNSDDFMKILDLEIAF